MVFIKKDGTIKQHYIDVCKIILTAKLHITEVLVGQHDEIKETYECYQISIPYRTPRNKRKDFENKISLICNDFGYKIQYWYSINGLETIDIKAKNINNMINTINELLIFSGK